MTLLAKIFLLIIAFQSYAPPLVEERLIIAFQSYAPPLVEERNNTSYQEATGNSRLLSSLTTNNHRIRELGTAVVLLIIFGHIFGDAPGNHTDIFPYTPYEREEQTCIGFTPSPSCSYTYI